MRKNEDSGQWTVCWQEDDEHDFYGCCAYRNDEQKPRRIAALRGIEVTQVSTGGWHCLALDSAGMVYAWGGNEYGQCHVEWAVR